MIVVLCNSFEEAVDAFHYWLNTVLAQEGAIFVENIWENGLCFETDDDVRYIFIDYHYADNFSAKDCDFIDEDRFFEGIDDFCGDYDYGDSKIV